MGPFAQKKDDPPDPYNLTAAALLPRLSQIAQDRRRHARRATPRSHRAGAGALPARVASAAGPLQTRGNPGSPAKAPRGASHTGVSSISRSHLPMLEPGASHDPEHLRRSKLLS